VIKFKHACSEHEKDCLIPGSPLFTVVRQKGMVAIPY